MLVVACVRSVADAPSPQPLQTGEAARLVCAPTGVCGGRLVVGQRAEPKTLNPGIACDAPCREVLGCMMADLIHINRVTQKTEPALAGSWKISAKIDVFEPYALWNTEELYFRHDAGASGQ